MKIPLTSDATATLTFQTYGPQPAIEGVWLHPLRKHAALEGWFMELLRLKAGGATGLPGPFELKQISLSRAAPGRINAFHVHPKEVQDELWCVVQGTMKVWLADIRQGSPTAGARRAAILDEGQPALLHIPTGVAHGYQAGPQGALLVYAMNNQFNLDDPNEGRLPWDYFGKELWEDDRG